MPAETWPGEPASVRVAPVVGRSTLLIILALAACADPAEPTVSAVVPVVSPSPDPTASPTPSATPETEVLLAAGDIASCAMETDSAVGALIAEQDEDATVAALGDLVYPNGTAERYRDCYDPAWGNFLDRTRPVAGNHDLQVEGGTAYWGYVSDRGGEPGRGWYSYELGAWHVVALNSNCRIVGCGPESPQHQWLTADLRASDARCTLAYWHHPMTSSGFHGRHPPVDPLWAAAVDAGVDLVLTGHEHYYERFEPLGSDLAPDADGTPLFIVGTGGIELRPAEDPVAGSEVIIDDAFGVLRLTLAADGYEWQFLALDGAEGEAAVADSGSAACR